MAAAYPFSVWRKFTQGLGTGMNPLLAQEAARSEREQIKKLLEGNDLVILVASLGGGAGSGAAPVFAQISNRWAISLMAFLPCLLPLRAQKRRNRKKRFKSNPPLFKCCFCSAQ